jgi:Ca2+-binding EF-hand superfamily protein
MTETEVYTAVETSEREKTSAEVPNSGGNQEDLPEILQNQLPDANELEMYRIVFSLFDRDGSGYIDVQDMSTISFKIGKDPNECKFHF